MRRRWVQPPITNIETDTREAVCLRVAADFLGLDARSVKARLEDGRLAGWCDGRWRVSVASLRRYDQERRRLAS